MIRRLCIYSNSAVPTGWCSKSYPLGPCVIPFSGGGSNIGYLTDTTDEPRTGRTIPVIIGRGIYENDSMLVSKKRQSQQQIWPSSVLRDIPKYDNCGPRSSARVRSSRLETRSLSNLHSIPRHTAEKVLPTPLLSLLLFNARSIVNKTATLSDFILNQAADLVCITETWIREGDNIPSHELTPPGFQIFQQPRSGGQGGGVAILSRDYFTIKAIPTPKIAGIECVGVVLVSRESLAILVVYRTPGSPGESLLNLLDLVADWVLKFPRLIVLGDFNVHVEALPSSSVTKDLVPTFEALGLSLLKTRPTHRAGHTLDLIFNIGVQTSVSAVIDIAPRRLLHPRRNRSPWYTNELRTMKQARKRLEHRWRRKPDEVALSAFKAFRRSYKSAAKDAKKSYNSSLIASARSRPAQVFKIVRALTSPAPLVQNPATTALTAEAFQKFFTDKITVLRQELLPTVDTLSELETLWPLSGPIFDRFTPLDKEDVARILAAAKPTTLIRVPPGW
ncbi:uncharacterized protein LOC134296596 [Anolis carolinensis]|uniref:uncharacterized protein LOC134296596 n=1 Tax=Anolis carolinensis TaxID=28377 RepID=UPI002F2B8B8F